MKLTSIGHRIRSGIRDQGRSESDALPRPSLLVIDGPLDTISVPATHIHVFGWVIIDGGLLPASIEVSLGGGAPVPANMGESRSDVGQHLGLDGPARWGWSATVPLDQPVEGTVELGATALDARGRVLLRSALECRFELDESYDLPVGDLDTPLDGASVAGRVIEISGRVQFPSGRVGAVHVAVNGARVARARTHTPSLGTHALRAEPDGVVSGFNHVLTVPAFDRHSDFAIAVEAESLDGRTWRSATHVVRCHELEARDDDRGRQLLERGNDEVDTLVVTHSLTLGGGQLWLSELLHQIHGRHGVRCAVVAVGDGPLRAELEDAGIRVHVTQGTPVGTIDEYEGRVREFGLLIANSGCQTVLVNTLGMFAAADAALRAGIPVVWAIHESFVPEEFLYLNYGALGAHPHVRQRFAHSLAAADRLVFEATQTSELFAHLSPASARAVIDYGIDTTEIERFLVDFDRAGTRQHRGFDNDDVVILMMGVFESRKAQALAVAAFEELAPVYPSLRLVLVGTHASPYCHAVQEQVERGENGDRITVVPITSDTYSWYAIGDVFLCASDVESLPRSVLEAMAFTVPVVSTDVFGLADLIDDDRTGWLFDARDLRALVAAMERVLTLSPAERSRVAERARRKIVQERDSSGYGDQFAKLLGTLAKVEA